MKIFIYILKKLITLVPVLFAISLMAFLLGVAAPGDPAYFALIANGTTDPTESELLDMRIELGLDRPIHVRYISWLCNALHGNFGKSFYDNRPVGKEILHRFPITVYLSLLSLVVTFIGGVGSGLLMAKYPNSILDRFGQLTALTFISVPGFWLAILLIGIFSEYLRWLPTSGIGTLSHMIMPAFVLSAGTMGLTIRLSRGSLLEEMHKQYIITAKSKGLEEGTILLFHGFPNALIPIVTLLGTYWGNILGGAVIVESIFSIPGIGQYAITAIMNRDFPVVQAYVLLTGTIFVFMNLIIDLFYILINPKIRISGSLE